MAKVINFVFDSAAHKMKAKNKSKRYFSFKNDLYCADVETQSNT